MVTRRQETVESIQKCLDAGVSKEELAAYLSKKSNNRQINERFVVLVHDLLYGELQPDKHYAEIFGISKQRSYQNINTIGQKARNFLHFREKEIHRAKQREEAKKNGEEPILDYYEYGPLDTRTVNALERAGITTAKQLYEMNPDDYWRVRNLGKSCFERIAEFKKVYVEVHQINKEE